VTCSPLSPEDANSGCVVVDTPGSTNSSLYNCGRWDEVVCETVIQTALNFKEVFSTLEKLEISPGE